VDRTGNWKSKNVRGKGRKRIAEHNGKLKTHGRSLGEICLERKKGPAGKFLLGNGSKGQKIKALLLLGTDCEESENASN